ncbi:MAG: aldehyde dehydrogenase family protein, partial [Pseudomonadota bacterium]|nr:aldehyde dehydrogenase family protein [Pseudomonadota bacterium]
MENILEAQKKAFLKEGPPSLEQRTDLLKRCVALIETYQDKIIDALNQDFQNRSVDEIKISEIDQTIRNILFTIKNLNKWMQPQRRFSSLGTDLLGAKSILQPSPLGTVGIIAPWNFPVGLIFYPLASIFAAGNRAMVKPSEITPATANIIKEGVEKYFDISELAVITGGPSVGERFSGLKLDHLLFIGSNRVAKKVAAQAAKNLVPTTLELGGKSPTIIGTNANMALAAERILFSKTLNAGQICLSPDYIFVKKDEEKNLISELQKAYSKFFPEPNSDNQTSMVNKHHLKRMNSYLLDANKKGAKVESLGKNDDLDRNMISTKIVTEVNDGMDVMKHEIFGPILPIMTYDSISDVVDYINKNDNPLGLYYFGQSQSEQNFVINSTRSGGVTVNDTMFHILQSRLPFGGVGQSGHGCFHGYEGFLNFSHLNSIYHQTNIDFILAMIRPPRGKAF